MIESDMLVLGLFILGFLGLGVALNNLTEILYWKWRDWVNRDR